MWFRYFLVFHLNICLRLCNYYYYLMIFLKSNVFRREKKYDVYFYSNPFLFSHLRPCDTVLFTIRNCLVLNISPVLNNCSRRTLHILSDLVDKNKRIMFKRKNKQVEKRWDNVYFRMPEVRYHFQTGPSPCLVKCFKEFSLGRMFLVQMENKGLCQNTDWFLFCRSNMTKYAINISVFSQSKRTCFLVMT